MIITAPLKLDNIEYRSHNIIDICELGDSIVFLHSALGDIPKEEITNDTVFPQYIVADYFKSDFSEHTQYSLTYHKNKVLYNNCCKCTQMTNHILLNTMHYHPTGVAHPDTLAKMIKVQDSSLCEIGESPEPIPRVHNDSKTFVFGEYSVRMVSSFIM